MPVTRSLRTGLPPCLLNNYADADQVFSMDTEAVGMYRWARHDGINGRSTARRKVGLRRVLLTDGRTLFVATPCLPPTASLLYLSSNSSTPFPRHREYSGHAPLSHARPYRAPGAGGVGGVGRAGVFSFTLR